MIQSRKDVVWISLCYFFLLWKDVCSFTSSICISSKQQHQHVQKISSSCCRVSLSRQDDETYTHMIGVPMEECHDLTLELESVQRAILYHCPILIHACIMPVVMRMPLLYIDTKSTTTDVAVDSTLKNPFEQSFQQRSKNQDFSSSPMDENTILTSRDPTTQAIYKIVNDVIQEKVYTTTTSEVQPILMNFKGLEVDGKDNEILHTIAMEGNGTSLVRQIMTEIQTRCHEKGWKTSLPHDPQQSQDDNDDNKQWRLRLPFMRVPNDFEEKINSSSSDNEMRLPENGGNGISPIFFYKWWEDTFLKKDGTRLRDIAVYGRTGGPIYNYKEELAFYVPHLKIPLPPPTGDDEALQAKEEYHSQYNKNRYNDYMDEESSSSSFLDSTMDDELRQTKSKADRRLLQTIYDSSDTNDETILNDLDDPVVIPNNDEENITNKNTMSLEDINSDDDISKVDEKKLDSKDINDDSDDDNDMKKSNVIVEKMDQDFIKTQDSYIVPDDNVDDEDQIQQVEEKEQKPTNEERIIQSIAKPIATGDWSKLKKKDKPKPEDNPILKNWKQRRQTLAADSPSLLPPKKKLPPYPSDEHFVGIWNLVSTPRGPSLDQQRLVDGELFMDPTVSENLILRVDGTVAGGPILDFETQHRASGGTWRMFQAEYMGNNDDNNNSGLVQTRLRIRLVIPPEKKRVLVMEGEVRRGVSMSTTKSISEQNMKEIMTPSSFNIPEVEALKKQQEEKAKKNNNDDETLILSCVGEVWVEDADDTNQNRVKLGRFSLIKAEQSQPSQLRFTIPSPKRYQD